MRDDGCLFGDYLRDASAVPARTLKTTERSPSLKLTACDLYIDGVPRRSSRKYPKTSRLAEQRNAI
jgi:hypothetical protein